MYNFYGIPSPFEECCNSQNQHYWKYGYNELRLNPGQYFSILTDYSDESKPLNFLESYFSENCDANIITTVGFGPGTLRTHELLEDPTGDHEYMFYFQDMPAALFPRLDPGGILTFGWFKWNIMCHQNQWMCEPPRRRPRRRSTTTWRPPTPPRPRGGDEFRRRRLNGYSVKRKKTERTEQTEP